MLKAMSVILICGAAFSALSQATSQFMVGTITGVQLHQGNADSNNSVVSYDVSLKVGNTTYVVLYTPPYGLQTVQDATGRQYLVRVGEKTITFNDIQGSSSELPIESQTAAETQSSRPSEAQSNRPSAAAPAQQTPIKGAEIIGLEGVKDKTEGTLTIEDGKLYFAHSGTKAQIAAAAMEDVVTADDSQRVIRGTLGTLSMFGPYGSGRVVSLLRSKIDSLTIKYRDDNGGLHGVVFTMPVGTAESFKQELIAQGAHTTIPAPAKASVDSSHQIAVEGKQ
ncbi:hypothetical protein [Edaphobacter aggregans]|uniref:hypothetical protein n=1 Tax=Edaphobacter aggregans TaxID=570835 RepID=UPI000552A908|nr:hypothetical protein [Edaphobacter aggregans]